MKFLIIRQLNYKFELLISCLGKLIPPLSVVMQTYNNYKRELDNRDMSHHLIIPLSLMDLK